MKSSNRSTGFKGESIASAYLQSKGFVIHETNSTSRWGEIDIIAEKDSSIHFVEVKTRKSVKQGKPVEAVTYRKLAKLKRAIDFYIKSKGLYNKKCSVDVIGITLADDGSVSELKHYPNVCPDLFL